MLCFALLKLFKRIAQSSIQRCVYIEQLTLFNNLKNIENKESQERKARVGNSHVNQLTQEIIPICSKYSFKRFVLGNNQCTRTRQI